MERTGEPTILVWSWLGHLGNFKLVGDFPPSQFDSALQYMNYLAIQTCKNGQSYPNCNGMMSGNTTYVSDWVYIVNAELNNNWYETSYVTLAGFKSNLKADIFNFSHPLNNLIRTTNLPNWGMYYATHYVVAYAYNFDTNTISYGDTAPNSANGGINPHPFGQWTWDLTSFYNELAPANDGYSTIMW